MIFNLKKERINAVVIDINKIRIPIPQTLFNSLLYINRIQNL